MPISLNHLKNDKRTITGDYFGDSFEVVYRPSVLTPSVESDLRAAEDNSILIDTLCEMIVSWDVLDEDNKPLPITPDVMSALPSALLGHFLQACREDMLPKPKSGRK